MPLRMSYCCILQLEKDRARLAELQREQQRALEALHLQQLQLVLTPHHTKHQTDCFMLNYAPTIELPNHQSIKGVKLLVELRTYDRIAKSSEAQKG